MSRHGTLALGLALGLAWTAPAPAWAAPVEPALDEGDAVQAPPLEAGEAGVDPTEADEPAADEPAADEPVADEPAVTPAPASHGDPSSAPAATHDVPADDFETEAGLAPGGYYGHGVILERPPPDGRNRIIVGSILVPLGTLATISSAVGTYMTVPSHCAERLGAATGIEATASKCQGLFTFNVIRTTYGVLMLGSGATILALGMIQRERYRKWRHEHGMRAHLEPTFDVGGRGAAVGLRLRF